MCTKQELAIFRRFDEIHLLNLLVLQDEIDQLSQELKKHEPPIDDVAAPPAVPLWYSLPRPIASHRQGVEDHEATMALHKRRAEIWNDLRLKLREYGKLTSASDRKRITAAPWRRAVVEASSD